ncbi:MAG: FUSC family protein [Actinobacteria bacterium]|nr:FUSC family protein [Actinomycetota bacterium]
MLKRIIKLFTDRKYWVRQIAIAGLSGGVAWFLGDLLIQDGGVVAAIVSTLSIRISLHKSIREGFGQIVGTAIGAGTALLAVSLFNFGFLAIATTIIICAVVARALHLGEVAAVNVPVTALIVIGPGISQNTAMHRLGSTLIGAAVAIFFSYFSVPNTPIDRARMQIKNVSEKAAALLAQMSEGVAAGYTQKDAGKWLAQARLLVEECISRELQLNIPSCKFARLLALSLILPLKVALQIPQRSRLQWRYLRPAMPSLLTLIYPMTSMISLHLPLMMRGRRALPLLKP